MQLVYLIDMLDATNEDFLEKFRNFDGPKNYYDLYHNINKPFFVVPDLRKYTIEFNLTHSKLYDFSYLKVHTS